MSRARQGGRRVLFVAAQLVAMTTAGERLVRQSGMTPSEYARSGFFQLCWATLVIVSLLAVSLRRMALYDERARVPRSTSRTCAGHPAGVMTLNAPVQAADRARRRVCDQGRG